MWIRKISVSGFKSLIDFEMELPKFTCLIGLNGAGKSTVLQFIDFLSQLVRGDMSGWLKERHWEPFDLRSRLTTKQTIDFTVTLLNGDGQSVVWDARYNVYELRCTSENIETRLMPVDTHTGQITKGISQLKVDAQQLSIWKELGPGEKPQKVFDKKIPFRYEGSVLSQLTDDTVPQLLGFKKSLSGINSMEMLAPESLRRRTRDSGGAIGLGGQRLSAFLYEMRKEERDNLLNYLKQAYPQLDRLVASAIQSGWKEISVQECFGERIVSTEARHINDGMLRLIAILAELQSKHEFVLFDEIENGINPELVEFVIGILTNARQQVMVTTHSPMILNYLDDDIARDGVMYLYKNRDGQTKAIPFFSIPSLAEKLTVMGPGEAFVDTNLVDLATEITELNGGK